MQFISSSFTNVNHLCPPETSEQFAFRCCGRQQTTNFCRESVVTVGLNPPLFTFWEYFWFMWVCVSRRGNADQSLLVCSHTHTQYIRHYWCHLNEMPGCVAGNFLKPRNLCRNYTFIFKDESKLSSSAFVLELKKSLCTLGSNLQWIRNYWVEVCSALRCLEVKHKTLAARTCEHFHSQTKHTLISTRSTDLYCNVHWWQKSLIFVVHKTF